ncbi:MAG: DUF4214 domain-containing protein [Acidimicrobiales bacterium]
MNRNAVRKALGRNAGVRRVYHRGRALALARRDRLLEHVGLDEVPDQVAVRLLYQSLLGREPDPVGFADNVARLVEGTASRRDLAAFIRGSEEFQNLGWSASGLGPSIHAGRCQFIRSLPAARHIVDLGGTHLGNEEGAMVALGYPYPFDELTIIDLPSDDRHELYRSSRRPERVVTRRGLVTYRYHSMTDLSGFGDATVDLVYSGQSIEHITPEEGRLMLKDLQRILRPGGHFALDTPNGRVTRMQQDDFIDPDHKVEYAWPELRDMLTSAGFEIMSSAGLNHGGPSVRAGVFDPDEAARRWGLHHELEDCYILAVVARKPI